MDSIYETPLHTTGPFDVKAVDPPGAPVGATGDPEKRSAMHYLANDELFVGFFLKEVDAEFAQLACNEYYDLVAQKKRLMNVLRAIVGSNPHMGHNLRDIAAHGLEQADNPAPNGCHNCLHCDMPASQPRECKTCNDSDNWAPKEQRKHHEDIDNDDG